MKKRFILAAMLLGLSLSACNQTNPKITGYTINESNNVIVIYDNGSQETVGNLSDEDIVNNVTSVTISQDGYFVINDIKTSTKVNFNSITISEDGYYVIDGIKTTIKASFNNITISSDGYYVVNGVKTNIKVQFDSVEISEDGYYVINGIKTDIKATEVYTVKFNTGYSATVQDQKVFEGHKVERPQLDRTGYTLNGWYCNGEEWRFNSDVVLNNMTLAAQWTAKQYTVSFVNEKGSNPSDLTVTYDSNYSLPTVEAVDGYTFGGWYNGNIKYSGGKWTTDSNITLTAKWTTNTYTITLDPGVGSVSQTSKTVTYGQSYSLPVPINNYGIFNGWLLDGDLVTDNQGQSLAPWTYTENKTFTVDWEIELYTEADLSNLYTYPGAAFKLMNDITVTATNWAPVGNETAPFNGQFDGDNHVIYNLTIDTSSISSRTQFGFFGAISGATIKNLAIFNFKFLSQNLNHSYTVGGLFGSATIINGTSTIENCAVEGTMSIASQSSSNRVNAGGIAGYAATTTFDKCMANIPISNAHNAGGIVGQVDAAVVSNSYNQHNISASSYAGGLVGISNTTAVISNSKNRGNVTGTDSAGGMIGWSGTSTTITNCLNTGTIKSMTNSTFLGAGGLVGATYATDGSGLPHTTVRRSYNLGSITSPMAGGLVGVTYSLTVSDSYNNGSVDGSRYSAGLCAFAGGTNQILVEQCLAAGSVSGSAVKSTLVGQLSGFSAPDCYHTYSSISSWSRTEGSYYNGSLKGTTLYVDMMYWSANDWEFNESSMPKLKAESVLDDLEDSWD